MQKHKNKISHKNINNISKTQGEKINISDIQLSLDGRYQAILEGAVGIVEYNSSSVKLSSKKCIIHFEGVNLSISTMSYSFAVIKGKINAINFIDI